MLPEYITARTPLPHTVKLFLKSASTLPRVVDYPTFCWGEVKYETKGDRAKPHDSGWSWLEVREHATGERILAFRTEDGRAPGHLPEVLQLEATSARLLWLAAYVTLRRVPSLAWLRRRGHMVGAVGLAECYLPGEDLELRWDRLPSEA